MQQVLEEGDTIEQLAIKIKHQCRHINNFITENLNNPESSPLISYSLILSSALFFVGVIYPLSFLPQKVDTEVVLSMSAFWDILFSIKGLILVSISLIFCTIMMVFFYINFNMKFDKTKISTLGQYSTISGYSIYFSNMEKNIKENGQAPVDTEA